MSARERGKVERAAGLHRRHDRDKTAGKHEMRRRKNGDSTRFALGARTRAAAFRVVRLEARSSGVAAAAAATRARPATAASRCTTAGRRPASRPCSNATTVSAASQPTSSNSPCAQQEIGIRRPAEALVAARRTSRRAARRRRPSAASRCGEQRPVQVVRDDDRVERLARRSGQAPASRSATRVSTPATPRSAASAAASRSTASTCAPRAANSAHGGRAGGDVEHACAGRNEVREALDPCGRAHRRIDAGDDACGRMRTCVAQRVPARAACRAGGSRASAGLRRIDLRARFERRFVGEPAQERRDVRRARRRAARPARSSRAPNRTLRERARRAGRRAGARRSSERGRARHPARRRRPG